MKEPLSHRDRIAWASIGGVPSRAEPKITRTETITKIDLQVTVGRLLFECATDEQFHKIYPRLAETLAGHGATAENSVTIDARGQILPFANQNFWEWANYFGSWPVRVYAVAWTEEITE